MEPADQILTLISKKGADAVLDLDESLCIVTDAVCFDVINNVPCRENVGICLQGIFGYKQRFVELLCIQFVLVAC